MTPYQQLEGRFARYGALRETISLLSWDRSVMMPIGSADAREAQISTLELVSQEVLTAPDIPELLADVDGQNDLDDWQRANVQEMRREWQHSTAVSERLLEAHVRAGVSCEIAWRAARPANEFAAVKPKLQRLLDLTREVATAKADRLGCSPYDALLDRWEPGTRAVEIDRLFNQLMSFLPDLVETALARQAALPPILRPEGPFPAAAQKALGIRLMSAVGFDFDRGRLDVSMHPFSGGTPDDTRITSRYDEADFTRGLMAVLHETGHAMYESGLPAAWRRQPVGRARGLGVHESQSLLLEMQACRSREFLEFCAPLVRDMFHGSGPAWEPDNLYRLYTEVARSPIRVYADEATYPAHVILRYRLERAMLAGDLPLDDLPEAWRDGMREMVGVAPATDTDGCLQDIHWYLGLWGYFPTYTIGAMTAAQLFDAATCQEAAIRPGLAKGDFGPLMGWLRRNVHQRASSVPAAQILLDASGTALDPSCFRRHLERRYLDA